MKKNNYIHSNRAGYMLPVLCGLLAFCNSSCKKLYNLPENNDYLSNQANFQTGIVRGVIGRTALLDASFNPDGSTFPMTFKIIDFAGPGDSLLLNTVRPVKVWKNAYTGTETTRAELEAKRTVENHPVFEIRNSGQFILWSTSATDLIKATPDSIYKFDVKITNSAGSRILGPIRFIPSIERPTEPSYNINTTTGKPILGVDGKITHILPDLLTGFNGATDNRSLTRSAVSGTLVTEDVWVYFKQVGNGQSLKIKFMNKDSIAINPVKFNGTDWANLLHHFGNYTMDASGVKYDLAYPIPLTTLTTKYTTADGSQAVLNFSNNRLVRGSRQVASMKLNFNIYREGDWEIIFFFHNQTPKLDDE